MSTTAIRTTAIRTTAIRTTARVPARSATRPAPRAARRTARARRAPLRLTRRGRLCLSGTATALLTTAVVAATGVLGGSASAGPESGRLDVLVVQSGQTLSEIATSVAPGEDWREVAAEIRSLNELQGSGLHAGQRLLLPAEG